MILEIIRKFFEPIMPLFQRPASLSPLQEKVGHVLALEARIRKYHDELWILTRELKEKCHELKWDKQDVYISPNMLNETGSDAVDRLRVYQEALNSDWREGVLRAEAEARLLNGEDQKYGC